MQTPVEIRYAGVVLGTSEQVEDLSPPRGGASLFIAFTDPLPVGTRLELRTPAGTHEARVESVVETGVAGMRVSLGAGEPDTGGVPQPAAEADGSGLVDAGAADDLGPDTSGAIDTGEGGKKKRRRKR